MQCVFHGPLLANGSWRVGTEGGREVFLVAEAAVDIHMRMKGATRSSPAVGVGPPRSENSTTVGRAEGTTAMTRTCPGEVWRKQGGHWSVAAQLGSSRSSILSAFVVGGAQFFGSRADKRHIHRPSGVTYFQIRSHTFSFCFLSPSRLLFKLKYDFSNTERLHVRQGENGRTCVFVAFRKSLV